MISIENIGKKIIYWGRDKDGKLYKKEDDSFTPYFYYKSENGKYITLFGDKVDKIEVESPNDVYIKREEYEHFEADIPYTNKYIIDKFDKLEKEPIRKCYLDIETELMDFKSLTRGHGIIKSITCYDSFSKKYIQFYLKDYSNEFSMLTSFIDYIEIKDPDMFVGWNIEGFDMPVIINRMNKLKVSTKRLSRLSEYPYLNSVYAIPNGNYWNITVKGRIIFDLMDGYKKLTAGHSGQRESYALDFISKYEFNEGKEEYDGSLDELYEKDIKKYLSYNKRDVELLLMIDDKLSITEYFDEIRRYAFCKFEDVFLNSKVGDTLILKFCNKKYVLPSKPNDNKRDRYQGAFVVQPTPALYKDIAVFDLKSLYPSIMVSCNVSPETLMPNSGEDNINVFDKYYFTKEKKGIVPQIIDKLFTERKKFKDLRDKEKYNSDEYKKYNNIQFSIKIIANGLYGNLGYPQFRIYSREVADCITLVARNIIKFSIEQIEKYKYKVIYGDTDSIFFRGEDTSIEGLYKILDKLNKKYDEFIIQLNLDSHIFEMEFEKLFKTIVFSNAKKRYFGRLKWYNGKENNDLIIVGFEERRSDSPQSIRDFQKKLFEMVTDELSKEDIEQYIEEFKLKFYNMREELGIPCTLVKAINKYSGNPVHVTAAKYSNKYHKTNLNIGSKFKYIYIVNGFQHVIGYEKKIPEQYIIDYKKMEDRLLTNKIQTLFECLGWKSNLFNIQPNQDYNSLTDIPKEMFEDDF